MVFIPDALAGGNVVRLGRSFGAVVGAVLTGGAVASAAWFAWAARGKSSTVFAPSVWHGPRHRKRIALTFDDGPTPGTAKLLDLLAASGAKATFFQCGVQVRRNPALTREVADAGHEIGNHTDTHARLWLRSGKFMRDEVARAQDAILAAAGQSPRLFRAPYGVRWPGLRDAQAEFGLLGVMWSAIGRDWRLDANGVAGRMIAGATPGAILCLHDGRELARDPDVANTVGAVRMVLPRLCDEGWEFVTVSELLGYSSAVCPTTSSAE